MLEPSSGGSNPPNTSALLTIVGYHYVRSIASSRFPAIKALDIVDFRRQLMFFRRHYHFVSLEDVVAAAEHGHSLPDRPLLLTFDDGYIDHYVHAWPALREFGISGAFYPTSDAVLGHRILDVNKIHFILASMDDHRVLVSAIEDAIRERGLEFGVLSIEEYRRRHWVSNRFDPPTVLYCKQMLQHGLPEVFRRQLASDLFHRFVTPDETSFAADLYMSVEQLQEMRSSGMHIGGHGGTHRWLDRLTVDEQRDEIKASVHLLKTIGMAKDDYLTFCYPYGGYNATTVGLLGEYGFRAGLTVQVALARIGHDSMLELPRLDTNDLPSDPAAPPGQWTLDARGWTGIDSPLPKPDTPSLR
ncbi:MAG: polysaccharide deacetylase family protein [Acidobacteriota bacterium]